MGSALVTLSMAAFQHFSVHTTLFFGLKSDQEPSNVYSFVANPTHELILPKVCLPALLICSSALWYLIYGKEAIKFLLAGENNDTSFVRSMMVGSGSVQYQICPRTVISSFVLLFGKIRLFRQSLNWLRRLNDHFYVRVILSPQSQSETNGPLWLLYSDGPFLISVSALSRYLVGSATKLWSLSSRLYLELFETLRSQ